MEHLQSQPHVPFYFPRLKPVLRNLGPSYHADEGLLGRVASTTQSRGRLPHPAPKG